MIKNKNFHIKKRGVSLQHKDTAYTTIYITDLNKIKKTKLVNKSKSKKSNINKQFILSTYRELESKINKILTVVL